MQRTDETTARAPSDSAPTLSAAVADTVSDIVGAITEVEATIASLQAVRAELLHQANVWCGIESSASDAKRAIPQRSLRAELACASRIPERTAERLIAESSTLTQSLPTTLAALRVGDISYRHAQLLVDAVSVLSSDDAATLEQTALPFARTLTSAKFERKLRALREGIAPGSIVERHLAAVDDREVQYSPGRDGMAWLSAYLPAADALGIFNRITEVAGHLRGSTIDGVRDERTLTQLRADVLRDLLIDGDIANGAPPRGIRPTVFVTVPALTLLGRSDEPAILDGYGPIDADTARQLAAGAPSFIRLLTHPETGAVLSVGQSSYRVPADLKNWLRVRDGTCRFPGCSRSARQTDIDHTIDWALGGETRHDNLAHLCVGHHTLKHATAWQVRQSTSPDDAPGTLEWISPSGRSYRSEPETRMRA